MDDTRLAYTQKDSMGYVVIANRYQFVCDYYNIIMYYNIIYNIIALAHKKLNSLLFVSR